LPHQKKPSPDSDQKRVLIPLVMAALTIVPAHARLTALYGETMGTTWQVQLILPLDVTQTVLERGIQQCLDAVVVQMSPWESASSISQFNHAPANTWHVLPDDFLRVLDYALFVAQQTQGAYDPSIGHLANLWGFGSAGKVHSKPDADAIAHAMQYTGWRQLTMRTQHGQREVLQAGNVHLDLSSIAKGFGVDQVARYVESLNVVSYLVEVGGELRGQGVKPNGQPWWVEIEPVPILKVGQHLTALPHTIVALHGLSIATSGDYRRQFSDAAQIFSHTIDPRTGYPVQQQLAAVTVLHAECMIADALATAMTVMGVEEGLRYANQLNVAALFVVHTANGLQERWSEQFQQMMVDDV
jgi:FAD:protein FMN transferase